MSPIKLLSVLMGVNVLDDYCWLFDFGCLNETLDPRSASFDERCAWGEYCCF